MNGSHTPHRNRWTYLLAMLAMLAVIGLGLASRKFPAMFPASLGKHPGDALWAMMVFAGYCVLLPRRPTWQLATLALATSYAVELSQLYQADWINTVRATTPGHLVLGSAFHPLDLLAYAIGTGVAAMSDGAFHRRRRP